MGFRPFAGPAGRPGPAAQAALRAAGDSGSDRAGGGHGPGAGAGWRARGERRTGLRKRAGWLGRDRPRPSGANTPAARERARGEAQTRARRATAKRGATTEGSARGDARRGSEP